MVLSLRGRRGKGGGERVYNLLINILDVNKRTNLGKIYLEKTYSITTRSIKANVT